jgi:hypothetical protein
MHKSLLGLMEDRYTSPLEVLITSATDDTLLHYRLTWDSRTTAARSTPPRQEILELNEARLKAEISDIFPLTVTITPGG